MSNADLRLQTRHTKRPVLLLVATNWTPAAARLAAAFIEHGCVVTAVCPPAHPLRDVHDVDKICTLRSLASRRSLEQAMQRMQPDLVVPCDDRSVALVHELHRLRPQLRSLIERSLGQPSGFEIVESRRELLETAGDLGIRIASTCGVTSAAEASDCFERGAPTAVLKFDGTSGGEGVQIVRSASEAAAAFRRTRFKASLPVALKRLLINREPMTFWSWKRRQWHTAVTLQQYVSGTPANIMVACWQGKIVAELSVQVLSSQGPTGASLVVQVIENRQLSRAAALLAAHLGLSGFFGLDFIIERGTGTEYLIEMNPRCTQLGHLKLPQGDLAGALCAALLGRDRPRVRTAIGSDTIAFFPQAWLWSAPSALLERAHHDVPWEQQQLVKALLQDPWPERQWLARLYHSFRRLAPLQAVETAPIHPLPERSFPERALSDRIPDDRALRVNSSR